MKLFLKVKLLFIKIYEDFLIFKIVHSDGNLILNLFYLPSFRIVFIFRLSQLLYIFWLFRPFAYFLTIFNDTFHGVWIGPKVSVGKGFYLGHPRGLVVNPHVVIGDFCAIIQQVTLGGPYTRIGNYVSINAGAMIISESLKGESVIVEDNCIVGAGALVLKSMPPNSVIGGVPAKVLKTLPDGENWVSRRLAMNEKILKSTI